MASENLINKRQDEIVEEFNLFDDWLDRYQLIIDRGRALEPLPESSRTPDNLIDGCQSRLWLDVSLNDDGTMHLRADSDAFIIKGIVAMLIDVLNDSDPHDIAEADLYFIREIGLRENLSPTRSNGLLALIKQIRAYALAYTMK